MGRVIKVDPEFVRPRNVYSSPHQILKLRCTRVAYHPDIKAIMGDELTGMLMLVQVQQQPRTFFRTR